MKHGHGEEASLPAVTRPTGGHVPPALEAVGLGLIPTGLGLNLALPSPGWVALSTCFHT